jgi:hypothetical protein
MSRNVYAHRLPQQKCNAADMGAPLTAPIGFAMRLAAGNTT